MQSYQPPGEIISTTSPASPIVSIDTSQHIAEGISLVLLGIFFCSLAGISGYKKYKIELRKKRIQTLERLWKLNIKEQSR